MKILFHLGHPAHFHLFKNVINKLIQNDYRVIIVIKEKDVLESLLDKAGLKYINILSSKDSKGLFGDLLTRGRKLYHVCKAEKPDLLVGTSADIGYVGFLLKISNINVNEDDANVVPYYSWLAYPFADRILSPDCCNNSFWNYKTTNYMGYHELAYLHPDHFIPNKSIVEQYLPTISDYFILRFSSLSAHHDKNVKGINDDLAIKIIDILRQYGTPLITSERSLSNELEPFRLSIKPEDIHHFLAFARFVIGDSQTMSAEAAVLGTPYIRFNDFVGRIGYLNELEMKYNLGFGIKPSETNKLLEMVKYLVEETKTPSVFINHREKLLDDKINTADFIYEYLINYK